MIRLGERRDACRKSFAPIGGLGVQGVVPSTKATRRARWAWYLYDFGNSAYASVVLLAVYSAYFKQQVVGGDGRRDGGRCLSLIGKDRSTGR